jgi:hypothetical protein
VKLQTLKREYGNLKMKENENVKYFCVRVKDVINKMATLGEPMSQEHVIQKVLRSLTPRWNTIVIVMKESKNLATMEYGELVGSLISHEDIISDISTSINEKDFTSQLQISKNDGATSSNNNNKDLGRGQNQNYSRRRGGAQGGRG